MATGEFPPYERYGIIDNGCTPKTGRWSQRGEPFTNSAASARSLDLLMRIWCRIPGVIIFPYVGTRPAASLMVFFSLTSRVLAVPRWPCPDLRDRRDPPRRQEFSMEDLCIYQQKPPFLREKKTDQHLYKAKWLMKKCSPVSPLIQHGRLLVASEFMSENIWTNRFYLTWFNVV